MIEVKQAKKYYNRFKTNQVTAIDNTSLTFGDNGLVAILGNSGCGKTTLLNMIGGLDKPDGGKIYVNGKKMNGLFSGHTDNIRNKNIGYIFQNYHLVDDITVFDNVALPLRMLGIRKKEQLKKSVYYALEMVGLYRYRNRPAAALSGGERQRVGIARAIVKNPGIIIADEPTGNLDSGNSLEVMNIIKAISKEKLVILVTHERTLAEFYADRIIEIVDGKVVSDKENEKNEALDYRIENKIYLQDFDKQNSFSSDDVDLKVYSDGSTKLNVTMVFRNGNLYIECEGKKAEIVDSDSPIEFVDDHYHALSKEEAEQTEFDYSKLELGKKKLRYHSIYNIFNLFINGVRKILNYPVLKKILLLGFVASAMFIMYSVSNYMGVTTIHEESFVTTQKDYLFLRNTQNTVASYQEAENLEGVKYVLPGDSLISFDIDYSSYYYQTNNAHDYPSGSLAAASLLTEDDLVAGRLPENANEIVIDELVYTKMSEYGAGKNLAFNSAEKYIGKEAKLGSDHMYTIVGVVDKLSPCIYAMDDQLFLMVMYASNVDPAYYSDDDNTATFHPIEYAKGTITIQYGRMPENDYEVIIPYDYIYSVALWSNISGKVNGKQLQVVGFYKSTSGEDQGYFTNWNTYVYKYIAFTANITICPEDAEAVKAFYSERNQNIEDVYETNKNEYMATVKESIRTTTIIAAVVLAVSLVEIFLMLRSSFLSRIKEVGTLRAIGLKKSDVYKMFLGEILVITTLTAPIGFVVMWYILKTLTSISYFSCTYALTLPVVLISVGIIYVFNIIVGLLPVFFTLAKTPARILSRTDVN